MQNSGDLPRLIFHWHQLGVVSTQSTPKMDVMRPAISKPVFSTEVFRKCDNNQPFSLTGLCA